MRRARAGPTGVVPSRSQVDTLDSMEQQSSSPVSTNVLDQRRSSDTSSVSWSSAENPASSLAPEVIWHPNAIISTSLVELLPTSLPEPTPASRDPRMTGDVILFQTQGWQNRSRHPQLIAPDLPHGSTLEFGEEDDLEGDPGIKQEIRIVPVLGPNTPENTLPFILQYYARWINLVVFEPGKGALPMKNNIVNSFMRFPEESPRIILLANAIGSLGKSITPSPKATSLVAYLSIEAHQHLNKFISDKSAIDREADGQKALNALDLVMEFMEAVAPVFRWACPEPMDRYVNLPRAVISPDVNIRNFAISDVILSATTGRPMLFRYDEVCPLDIFQLLNDGRYGMQWLHGVPDQYIIIIVRINVLAEELEFETTISPHCVAEIERQIREVETSTGCSADPVSMIWKYTVRECWKLTTNIYLYMVLCRMSTDDPRVLKSVKSYVRLVQAVKSGRNPDAFLYIPMIIVGALAYRKEDRVLIQHRMLGL
ncbi:hypothetical protein B0J17DRAFT_721396 [Rhizoctonia solani]|nr:hypothetical protein B0J17DRAFT_721396 [Rhizoctonia solani]